MLLFFLHTYTPAQKCFQNLSTEEYATTTINKNLTVNHWQPFQQTTTKTHRQQNLNNNNKSRWILKNLHGNITGYHGYFLPSTCAILFRLSVKLAPRTSLRGVFAACPSNPTRVELTDSDLLSGFVWCGGSRLPCAPRRGCFKACFR